jgi:uroporphyrin-III C-methyltransferase/precorrin-2 dehydrogenase/sirohydrochlorin ferrochelatase
MEAVPNGAPYSAEAVGAYPTPAAGAMRRQSAGRTAARPLAWAGTRVVRPKGGDPLIFGRGGEEAAALAEAGIACGVVPRITAALACAAQAGMPPTHRDAPGMLTPLTGHARDGRPDADLAALGRPGQGSTRAGPLRGTPGAAPILPRPSMAARHRDNP